MYLFQIKREDHKSHMDYEQAYYSNLFGAAA